MSFPENENNTHKEENENKENKEKNDAEFSEFNDSATNMPVSTENTEGVTPSPENEKLAQLEKEFVSVSQKLTETHNKMLRIAADADNTRKRLEKEKFDARIYSIQEFARDLLPVIDAFEKALHLIEKETTEKETPVEHNQHMTSMVEGVKLVSKIFQDVTKKHGIERLPGKGEQFNPMYHNAIAKETGPNYSSEVVIEEFMPGYKIGDRVLRTALVKVGAPD